MSGRPRLVPVLSSSRTTAPFQVRLHFRYWHNPDVQALAFLGPHTAGYPRLGYVETGRAMEDEFDRVFYRKELS